MSYDEAFSWARTEAEVAADAVWALIEAGILSRRVPDVARILDTVGISRDDLRLASIRWERRYRPAPTTAPTRTDRELTRHERRSPEIVKDARRSGLPPIAGPPALALLPDPTDDELDDLPEPEVEPAAPEPDPEPAWRQCRKCRELLPIDDFPTRGTQAAPRIGHWCRTCSEIKSVRVVQQRRVEHEAYVTLVLAHGDECVGMACAGCGHALAVGDSMVVAARPRHEHCAGGA